VLSAEAAELTDAGSIVVLDEPSPAASPAAAHPAFQPPLLAGSRTRGLRTHTPMPLAVPGYACALAGADTPNPTSSSWRLVCVVDVPARPARHAYSHSPRSASGTRPADLLDDLSAGKASGGTPQRGKILGVGHPAVGPHPPRTVGIHQPAGGGRRRARPGSTSASAGLYDAGQLLRALPAAVPADSRERITRQLATSGLDRL